MRILWLGNPPWVGSGYGQQAALFIPRLQQLGHEVAVACNWGLNDSALEWGGLTCYPADGVWGNRSLHIYAKDWNADLVLALCDAWVLNPKEWPAEGPPVAVWAPVDHSTLPPAVLDVLAHGRIRPIAMSRFGERLMTEAELNPSYVPHGIDTGLFRPRPELRQEARTKLGIPDDAFVAGMVAANVGNPSQHRKAFPEVFSAVAEFMGAHPDAWFYCHTQGNPRPGAGGINLYELAQRRGLPLSRVRVPSDEAWHRGIPAAFVALVYQAIDVLLLPSMGEGFGIPLLEAQASGVPVITSNHSAMAELAHAGWLVSGQPANDEAQKADFFIPFISAISDALEAAYQARGDQIMREAAAQFALGYDADLVTAEHWQPALEKLAPAKTVNRAARRAAKTRARV